MRERSSLRVQKSSSGGKHADAWTQVEKALQPARTRKEKTCTLISLPVNSIFTDDLLHHIAAENLALQITNKKATLTSLWPEGLRIRSCSTGDLTHISVIFFTATLLTMPANTLWSYRRSVMTTQNVNNGNADRYPGQWHRYILINQSHTSFFWKNFTV